MYCASELKDRARTVLDEVKDIRRRLHRHPELSGREVNTSRLVLDYLQSHGITARQVDGGGVVGTLVGGRPGPRIAVRADMDALPLHDEKQVPYASAEPGVMHACGHDAHVAMLLGAARLLSGQREEIAGEIVFLFQASEEAPPGGALGLIADGCLDGVSRVCGIHVWNSLATGRVWVGEGPVTAASDRFTISIQGRGGHGALPHQCVDSVLTGAAVVTELQQIVSRRVDPVDPAVVTVGSFHAGSNFNVIADSAKLTGTVRTFDEQPRALIEQCLRGIVDGVCGAHGASGEVEYLRGYPPTVCDPRVAEIVRGSCEKVLGPDCVVTLRPVMGGEDFAYYVERVPGTLLFLGSGGEMPEQAPPHHHPMFDIDEEVLLLGVACWQALVGDLLAG